MTKTNYDALIDRKKLNRLQKGGNGRPALIEFESIRPDIKEKIIAITGDPTEKAKHITFIDYIKTDDFAAEFFNSYTLESGDALPEKNRKEYIANAEVLNAIDEIVNSTMGKRKALGSKVKVWPKIAEVVAELPQHRWPHSLPANPRRLQDKLRVYKADGYESLIHKGFCHKNTEKLCDDAKRWVLARWADQVQKCATHAQLLAEYNRLAPDKGWKPLKVEQTLINFLQDPKIEPLWYGYRYGELKSKEKYSFQFSTKLPSMRDGLWYSDGTKLNYYYQDDKGKMQTCQVYEVFDVYSEVFLGYHISNSEDFEAQYMAYKMAAQIAGHKPYEIKYDNQGGTKTLESQSFLGKLGRLCTNTRPYNGKSKTIESAFGRFQAEYLKKDWFFTGQNVTTKKLESKPNMEFVLRNTAKLPTLDKIKEVYAQRRREWNEAPHHATGVSKIEMYLNSQNPGTPELRLWDMINMFWIERKDPVTCTAYGITYTDKKVKYTYMVYDDNNLPDLVWLRNNIDKKFVIKYDPDDRSTIQLYENTPLGLRHAGAAQIKVEVNRGRQEQEDWEASYITQIIDADKAQRIAERDKMDAILKEQGRTAEDYGLRSPLIKGVESSRKKQKATKKETTDIGQYQKELSNAVVDVNDIYSHM
ncbi:kinase [Flavobacterium rivuli]|uniref:kinase n=1 Tax=Flavobacterium rivuli TaxID=498301 RepID=UPI0014614D02|nr:kinase [Flavobacterium rivuli]